MNTALPSFSVLITSHNKWPMVCHAIDSVLGQTYPHIQLLVVNSGACDRNLRNRYGHRIDLELYRDDDTTDTSTNKAAAVLNHWIPRLRNDWISYCCDDDLYFPTFFEAMARQIAEIGQILTVHDLNPNMPPDFSHPPFRTQAPRCFVTGQLRVRADADGTITHIKDVVPAKLGLYQPGDMDCKVDYLQFVFHKSIWKEVGGYSTKWEDRQHADGIFMEQAIRICRGVPVHGIHCINRRTPLSRFCGTS